MTTERVGAATALVIIVDHEEWRVYELPAPFYDRRGGNTLVFESDTVVRRVRNFPDTWRALSAPDLLRLSWTA